MTTSRILVVDDDARSCEFLKLLLTDEGFEVDTLTVSTQVADYLASNDYDLVITDLRMEGVDGIGVLQLVRRFDQTTPVIIMTAFSTKRSAIEAVNKGAFQYIEKGAGNEEILATVRKALEMRAVTSQNYYLKKELKKTHRARPIIGKSKSMLRVFEMIEKVADSDSTILIYGESGTGKELVAREIHYESKRANGPFVSINCGALPKDLLESNLFGHKKGSFTGAIKDQDGLFKVADGGSFFLDEVGETSPATQVKLLRVLQEKEIIPVGGTKPIKVHVRLIAATNTDLDKLVAEGRFRADLYYRLNVIPIELPPLRMRRDDIPLLADHFLKQFTGRDKPKTLSPEVMEIFSQYHWPGNVRELENVIERAVILTNDEVITKQDLPRKLIEGARGASDLVIADPVLSLEELERQYILRVLDYTNWQKRKASQILGINASTLYRKLLAYGIQSPPGRPQMLKVARG